MRFSSKTLVTINKLFKILCTVLPMMDYAPLLLEFLLLNHPTSLTHVPQDQENLYFLVDSTIEFKTPPLTPSIGNELFTV